MEPNDSRALRLCTMSRTHQRWCVFRPIVTARSGIVTGDFGIVTEWSGAVTGEVWRE